MTPIVPPPTLLHSDDFRAHAAQDKRERMRRRLQEAAIDALLARAPAARPLIDDVVELAKVSRGTFYRYYESVDELLDELSKQMVDDTLQSFEPMFDQLDDPAARAAGGPLLSLLRAAMQPRRVAISTRIDMLDYLERSQVQGSTIVMRCLDDGRASGVLAYDSLGAALDFAIGATREGVRRVAREGPGDGVYIREVTRMVLTGLGMALPTADRAITDAWLHFNAKSKHVAWWRPVPPP